MRELEFAKLLAEKILDQPNIDPDEDKSVLARQFLRAIEAKEELLHALASYIFMNSPPRSLAKSFIEKYDPDWLPKVPGPPDIPRACHRMVCRHPMRAHELLVNGYGRCMVHGCECERFFMSEVS